MNRHLYFLNLYLYVIYKPIYTSVNLHFRDICKVILNLCLYYNWLYIYKVIKNKCCIQCQRQGVLYIKCREYYIKKYINLKQKIFFLESWFSLGNISIMVISI